MHRVIAQCNDKTAWSAKSNYRFVIRQYSNTNRGSYIDDYYAYRFRVLKYVEIKRQQHQLENTYVWSKNPTIR